MHPQGLLKPEQKAFLANGIFRAVTQDLPEIVYENGLPTNVGAGLFRWNFINRNLAMVQIGDFEYSFPKRGAWKFILLRDRASNLSFSVMTEQNFKRLQHTLPLHAHYLEALVSKNEKREPIEGQIRIEGTYPNRNPSVLSDLRDQLLCEFSGVIKEHALVLFDYNYTGVTSARIVLLTPTLDIAMSEDWTEYLTASYNPSFAVLPVVITDEDQPLVRLKPQYDSGSPSGVKQREEQANKEYE